MRRFVLLGAGVLLFLIAGTAFLGCGGGGGAASAVGSITLAPTNVSLNRGATAQVTVQALDANNNVIPTPTLAYNSVFTCTGTGTEPCPITVSGSGLICAGQWDTNQIKCQTTDNNNNQPLGLATASITATATVNNNTITSSAVVVTDHEPIDRVQVIPSNPQSCVSQNGKAQFTAEAFSNDPAACQRITAACPSITGSPCRIPDGTQPGCTNTIGSINWAVSPAQVATADAVTKTATDPVIVTAAAPGRGVVVGSVGVSGSLVSGSAPFTTCAVASIHVHQQNTPMGTDTETLFTAPVGATVPLVADVFDSNTPPVKLTSTLALTWLTSQPALASVSPGTAQGATVQALAPGTAQITAACLPPSCNVNLNQAIYSDDVVTANITGTVDSTVLVTTSTAPTSSGSNSIVPINTGTNNPGTAFVLPANLRVNSMVLTPQGNPAFLGTECATGTTGPNGAACSGLLRFDPTVTTVAAPVPTITGTVLATDGVRVVVSDPASNQTFIATAGPAIEAIPAVNNASFIAAAPAGATESGNTVTITTTTPHGLVPGQSVMVVGVGVAGYNGVYTVQTPVPSPTTFTYTDPNSGLAASGGGYVTGGSAAAITADGSKIYIVTGGKLYIYHPGLRLQNQALSGTISPTSSQAVAFFATGPMAYVANSAGDDVVATCNDAIQKTPPAGPVPVAGFPTHIAAVPNATAVVDANSPNIDEVDASADSAATKGACPPLITNSPPITNSFTSNGVPVSSFTAKQLIVTPDSKLALILSDKGVLAYDLGTKQTSVITLAGGPPAPQPLSGGVTPDSANLYVGATDGKVHRIDLKTLTDAQSPPITVALCPSVSAGCNPDFVVVRPVATVVTLSSIAVTPTTPTISVNGTAQNCPAGAGLGEICFTATGTFSDKTTRDLTSFVVWTSSNTLVAIIGPTTATPPLTIPGRARALAAGTTTISATSAGVTGSTTLTVLQ